MVSQNIERLLEGPIDPTWPLILHVAPIIETFIETKGRVVLSIDDVFFGYAATRREAEQKRIAAEERLTQKFLAYLDAAVPDMHAVSNVFAGSFKPGDEEQTYDVHTFENQEQQYRTFADHLGRMMKLSPYFRTETREEVGRVVEHFRRNKRSSGFSLENRRVHLGIKHGSLGIDRSPSTPVVFSLFRVKDERRYAEEKLPRVIASRVMDYFTCTERLKRTAHPDLPKSSIEAFGAMEYFGLATPFSEGAKYTMAPDQLEYMLMAARISDVAGVMFVGRNRDDVNGLLNRLINGNFLGSETYTVLNGKNLRKRNNIWRYEEGPIIDDHAQRDGNDDARPIFLYLLKRGSPIRVDLGLTDIHGLAKDSPPNERAHPLYEQKQLQMVAQWPLPYQKLFSRIAEAFEFIPKSVNVRRYPLYTESTMTAK